MKNFNNFAQIPEALIYDKEVSGNAIKVYGCLDRHLNKKTGKCFPGHRRISDLTGLSRSCIQRCLKILQNKGLKIRPGEPGYSNNYELIPLGKVALKEGHSPAQKEDHPGPIERQLLAYNEGTPGPNKEQPPALQEVHNDSLLTIGKNETNLTKAKDDSKDSPSADSVGSSDFKIFNDWYSKTFLEMFKEAYPFNGAKDGQAVKRLLKAYDVETIKAKVLAAFKSSNSFHQNAARSIALFASVASQIEIKSNTWTNDPYAHLVKKVVNHDTE
jgi:biotin operon repressor